MITSALVYQEPFASGISSEILEKGNIIQASQSATRPSSSSRWIHCEDNWVCVDDGKTSYLEKIELYDTHLSGDYTARSDRALFSEPSLFCKLDTKVSEGRTESISGGRKDQFESLWGKTSEGKWILISDENGTYFDEGSSSKSDSDTSSSKSSTPEVIIVQSAQSSQAPAASSNASAVRAVNASLSSTYVLADSASRYYTREELYTLSSKTLNYACNEIYARHGYIFVSNELNNFFKSKSRYVPRVDVNGWDKGTLSDIEKANTDLMHSIESGKSMYQLS